MVEMSKVPSVPAATELLRVAVPDSAPRDFSDWVKQGQSPVGQITTNAVEAAAEGPSVDMSNEMPPTIALPALSAERHGMLYGWRLVAQQVLSQLIGIRSASTSPDASGQENPSPVLPLASGASGDVDVATSLLRPGGPPSMAGLAHLAHSVYVTSSQAVSIEGTDAPALSAATSWLQRSLRRITSPEGQTTVWLRDYRIRDEDIPTLVGHLLSQQDSTSLHRIMINGVEVWRQSTFFSER